MPQTTFNPEAAGFRVATTPIVRKPRTPSPRPQPKPQYTDSVWWSFEHGQPLEVEVSTRAVEDTVRKLKRAARYLDRTRKPEVRVQISVEPVLDPVTKELVKPAKSVVKFLGHAPWALGRRVAKMEADARAAGQEAGEQAAEDAKAPVPAPRHRRTTAGTRSTAAHRRKASLPGALVWAVISPQQPSFPVSTRERGLLCFRLVTDEFSQASSRSLLWSFPGCTMSSPLQQRGGFGGQFPG